MKRITDCCYQNRKISQLKRNHDQWICLNGFGCKKIKVRTLRDPNKIIAVMGNLNVLWHFQKKNHVLCWELKDYVFNYGNKYDIKYNPLKIAILSYVRNNNQRIRI